MTLCPDCGYENIDGADECEMCHQPLSALSKRAPASEVERSIVHDRVSRLEVRDPLLVRPDMPVGEVLRRMVEGRRGCAIVVEGTKLVGIFTERDALVKLNVDAARLAPRPVSEFMTRSVETLELDDRIAFALHKMDVGGYRHIPILSEGQVTGVISVRHILDYLTAAL